jgi:hypothetical protein
MVKFISIILPAMLSMTLMSDVSAAECKPYKKMRNMYRIVDDDGKVFFSGSPNHPACSDLIENGMGRERKQIQQPQAAETPAAKTNKKSQN